MAEPWLKYGSFKEPQSTGIGPWSKYGAKSAAAQQSPVSSPQEPVTVNREGKGDLGLGSGEVAPMTYATDMARSLATGVGQGIIGLAGLPRDMGDLAQIGIEYVANKAGFDGKKAGDTFSRYNPGSYLPSSATISSAVQDNVTGPFYEPQTLLGEYSKTVGEIAPSALMGPGGVARKTAMTVASGVASEAAGQATKGKPAEPYARIVGAISGGMAPSALRRVVTPLPISAERQQLINTLKKEGVELTAGQSSGRNGLKYAESELGGGKVAGIMERQAEQFTSAALKRAGINAKRATPDVMDEAFTRIGSEFDRLASSHSLPPNRRLAAEVQRTVADYESLVPSSAQSRIVTEMANDIYDGAANGISGKSYQAYRSRLEKMAQSAKADTQLSDVLRDMKNSLDDAMERTLQAKGSHDLVAWKQARKEYRNILVLERAATSAGENAAQGLISPAQLRNATVSKQGRRNYGRGKGDFADLARAGEATMKPLPQSGTAPRTAVRNLGASVPSVIGAALGSPMGIAGSLAGAVAGAAVPAVAGRTILSGPAKLYLKNQLLSSKNPLTAQERAAVLALIGESAHSKDSKNSPIKGVSHYGRGDVPTNRQTSKAKQ
jgi:hypothetical protein